MHVNLEVLLYYISMYLHVIHIVIFSYIHTISPIPTPSSKDNTFTLNHRCLERLTSIACIAHENLMLYKMQQ